MTRSDFNSELWILRLLLNDYGYHQFILITPQWPTQHQNHIPDTERHMMGGGRCRDYSQACVGPEAQQHSTAQHSTAFHCNTKTKPTEIPFFEPVEILSTRESSVLLFVSWFLSCFGGRRKKENRGNEIHRGRRWGIQG